MIRFFNRAKLFVRKKKPITSWDEYYKRREGWYSAFARMLMEQYNERKRQRRLHAMKLERKKQEREALKAKLAARHDGISASRIILMHSLSTYDIALNGRFSDQEISYVIRNKGRKNEVVFL